MLGILSGLFLLMLSFYLLYQGSVMGNNWIRLLGVVLSLGSGILIAVSRLRLNVEGINIYKEALRNLSKKPHDEKLKEIAYHYGVNYYKNKRDNRTLLPMDKEIINRDITMAIQKRKK